MSEQTDEEVSPPTQGGGEVPLRVLVVFNDKAGQQGRSGAIERRLRDAGSVPTLVGMSELGDRGPGAIEALAKRCADENIKRVVVAGGDGSIGLVASVALRAGLPLAVVPTGTANSLARWLGLPTDIDEALALAVQRSATLERVEVAQAGGRPFVNVAGTGLSVLASRRARPLKKRYGAVAYTIGAAWAATKGRPFPSAVSCDGETVWRGDAWQILVAASGAFGAASATGGVNPEDRQLDVAVLAACPRIELLRLALAMRRGTLLEEDHPSVLHFRGRTVGIDMGGEPIFNVDGDLVKVPQPQFAILGQVEVVTGSVAGAQR